MKTGMFRWKKEFLEQENNVEGVRRKLKKDVRKGGEE
jgi:hypothetical protein